MPSVSAIKARLTVSLIDYILRSSKRRTALLLAVLEHLGAGNELHRANLHQLRSLLHANHSFFDFLKRLNARLSHRCRNRLVANLVVRGLLGNGKKRNEFKQREGFFPPLCVSIAPTSRCNLRCDHCSAGVGTGEDMEPGLVVRLIQEARDEMGVHFFILTGGEPFVYGKLLSVIESFPDCYFQIFTNGTLLDGDTVRRLERSGNALVMISIEGDEEATDLRRSSGTFRSVEGAMERLGAAGVPFGYSIMTTSGNCETVTGEGLVDWAVGRGCLVGYYFHYMPVGSDPDISLMPSPAQRDTCRRNVYRLRNEKPIFLVDVVNDGPLTGGCTSSGRYYVHILPSGDVTPCVYSNFSTVNINKMSLTEALGSPFLSKLRRAIPFEGNALRCCLLLDRPGFYLKTLDLFHPRSSIPGEAERLRELKPELTAYAGRMKEIYDRAWEQGDWESVIRSLRWKIGD